MKAVSVSKLNRYINSILVSDPILSNVSVVGELSNLTRHSTGHWYFSIKDENSTLRCFFARDRVESLRYDLEEGMQITCIGGISVFERGGTYSLNVRDIQIEGEGELKKAYDLLFRKLEKEGLFDESKKRAIPTFPKRIGVVTSPTGAAIRDIMAVLKRRNPLVDMLLYPSLVQGPGAAESIKAGIEYFNREKNVDVIIAGRGGGSMEDLWAFNEEPVARAIAKSKIPVISAVGHETDFVISDFAADLRAATPTAAAELAAPDIAYYKDTIESSSPKSLYRLLKLRLDDEQLKLSRINEINRSAFLSILTESENRLRMLRLDIDSLNPMLQLDRGYAIVKNEKGSWIVSAKQADIGDKITVMLKDGELECSVSNRQLKN